MQQLKKIESVFSGNGVWLRLQDDLNLNRFSSVFILIDANTKKHCLPVLLKNIRFEKQPFILEMKAGEHYKNIDTCMDLWLKLSNLQADRNSLLINLGGGVVTDLGGFVASTFKRGISFVNIPTSLLAMVDAAIGGKNGIDLGVLKNQIGVHREPQLVLLDTQFLNSLPQEHLVSGLAEMLKHGLISSESYFERVVSADLSTDDLSALIWTSVEIKHAVVSKDPFEQGLRKTLNFGHTLGHAIESYRLSRSSEKTMLHGEAVAIGMILETYISSETIGFPKEKLNLITRGILKRFPKVHFSKLAIKNIIELLIFDKKNRNGKVLFVLLENFGKAKIDCEVSNSLIQNAFDFYKNF